MVIHGLILRCFTCTNEILFLVVSQSLFIKKLNIIFIISLILFNDSFSHYFGKIIPCVYVWSAMVEIISLYLPNLSIFSVIFGFSIWRWKKINRHSRCQPKYSMLIHIESCRINIFQNMNFGKDYAGIWFVVAFIFANWNKIFNIYS